MSDVIWSMVSGFEGYYEVSSSGLVRSVPRIAPRKGRPIPVKGVERKMCFDKNGYCIITLKRNGSRKCKKVHRLVAEAFLPNPCNKPHVNHKNGNKADNRVENLEWATLSENQLHAVQNKLRRTLYISNSEGVVKSRKDWANSLNVSVSMIDYWVKGKRNNKHQLQYAK